MSNDTVNVGSWLDSGVSGPPHPKRFPRKAVEICSANWAWSPGNSREDVYHIHLGRTNWYLWLSYFNECDDRIERIIVAYVSKDVGDLLFAARLLLTEFWKRDSFESDIGAPNGCWTNLLGDDEIREIVEVVWGCELT